MPREHGAYGQLAFPALSALASGRPTVASAALIVAAVAAFLGHEPVLVLLGRRGTRAAREDGPRARRALSVSLGVAVAAAGAAVATAHGALWTLAPVAALGLIVLGLVLVEREKTTAGEIVVAVALSSLALPVGALSDTTLSQAAVIAGVWALGFSLATVAVREAIRDARGGTPRPLYTILLPSFVAVGAAVLVGTQRAGWWPVAPLPFVVASAALLVARPAPRHMRRVGWSLIAASAATLVAIVVICRTHG